MLRTGWPTRRIPLIDFKEKNHLIPLIIFIIFFLIRTIYSLFYAESNFHLQTNELMTTAMQQMGLLPFNPENLGSLFYHDIPTFIPQLEVWVLKIANHNYKFFIYPLTVLNQIFFSTATFLIGRKMSQSNWGGLFSFLLCSLSWPTYNTIGYGFINYASLLAPGYVFQSIGIGLLALALYGYWRLVWILLGVSFNFHPIISFIIASFLISYFFLEKPQSYRQFFIYFFLMAILALPACYKIVSVAQEHHLQTSQVDWSLWWQWMRMTKTHHVFPWRYAGEIYGYTANLFLFTLLISILSKQGLLQKQHRIFSINIIVISTIFLCITAITVEYLKIPLFGSAMLSRSTVFTIPFLITLLSIVILNNFNRASTWKEASLSMSTFFLLTLPMRSWDWQIRLIMTGGLIILLLVNRHGRERKYQIISFLVLFFMSFFYAIYRYNLGVAFSKIDLIYFFIFTLLIFSFLIPSQWIEKKTNHSISSTSKTIFLIIILFIYLFFINLWSRSFHSLESTMKYTDYMNFTKWISRNTSVNSEILIPPIFNKTDVASHRVILPDGGLLGISMYGPELLGMEQKAMQEIYGYDIANVETQQYLIKEFRSALILSYQALTPERINQIKIAYPHFKYLVEDITQSPFHQSLPYERVYSNHSFVIYDITHKSKPEKTTVIYSLWPTGGRTTQNWESSNPDMKYQVKDHTLYLTSNESKYNYQLISKPIEVIPNKRYIIEANIAVQSGLMSIGILEKDQWIAQIALPKVLVKKPQHLLEFLPQTNSVQLVIFNNNAKNKKSLATIQNLDIISPAS